MRLWLKRNSDVNLREQLSTQIILGILGNELAPGDRLPSTRELAQRHGIHPNTASAAYKELEDQGWLEVRHGSGVYVRATRPSAPHSLRMSLPNAPCDHRYVNSRGHGVKALIMHRNLAFALLIVAFPAIPMLGQETGATAWDTLKDGPA